MATSPHNRAFQAYNSQNFKNRPVIKKPQVSTSGEPLAFGRIPYSSMKKTVETISTPPSTPGVNSVVKPVAITPKRRSSTPSLGNMLPRRKSLQMTALASQRQTLWISIAKNAQANNTQSSPFPLRQQQTNLLRKKILRLLLVFSYLLSISLFAIALATFYGVFWTGSSIIHTSAEISNGGPIALSTSNTTIVIDSSLEKCKLIENQINIHSDFFYLCLLEFSNQNLM
jgi:hypothetical protein